MSHRPRNPALAAALAVKGMTGKELAAQAGVHPVTVSAILNLRVDPRPETMVKIASALDTSPESLWPRTEGQQ